VNLYWLTKYTQNAVVLICYLLSKFITRTTTSLHGNINVDFLIIQYCSLLDLSYPSTKWTLFVCLLLIFIRWVQGLKKFQFGFLGDHILCIKCGPSIKFHDILTNKVETLHLPTKYSTVLSIHPLEPYFAVTELCNVNPKVYVYSYPQKDEIILKSKLQPDSQALSILIKQMLPNWRYNSPSFPIPSIMQQDFHSCEILCKTNLNGLHLTTFSFCPTDWHYLLGTDHHCIHVWQVETCDRMNSIKCK
ncbi:uncharacterized protein DC041_0003912, partial [Schistosoma bovis]